MLKMIIADDERVIRESISCLIDWEKLGVELTGLCRNGLEAYDMIIDEAPDIVLTDAGNGWSGTDQKGLTHGSGYLLYHSVRIRRV